MSQLPAVRLGIAEAFAVAAALDAAQSLGLLSELDRQRRTVAALARRCGGSRRAIGDLVKVLACLGLVTREDDTFAAAAPGLSAIPRSIRAQARSIVEFATGKRPLKLERPSQAARYYQPEGLIALARRTRRAARVAAAFLPRPRSVLDLGAGAAPWSIAVARRAPECSVTAVDLPGPVAAARQAAASARVASQFRFVEGDLFAVDLPRQSFDLVFIGLVLHLFDDARARQLLRRARKALTARGVVVVIEVVPRRNIDLAVRIYELGLHMRSSGRVRTSEELTTLFRSAGLRAARAASLPFDLPLRLLTARPIAR